MLGMNPGGKGSSVTLQTGRIAMHRALTLAAAAAVLFTAAPAFADAGAPYKLDAKGKCHDAKGGYAKTEKCSTGAMASTTGGHCRDAKTKKYVKCGTPGSEPVAANTAKSATTSATTASTTATNGKAKTTTTTTKSTTTTNATPQTKKKK
jgi:hypothetical protein